MLKKMQLKPLLSQMSQKKLFDEIRDFTLQFTTFSVLHCLIFIL